MRLGDRTPSRSSMPAAGPGALARAMLAADRDLLSSIRYVAVDVSDTQRALHPAGVESRADLPDGPFDGVIVANELLDNLPFRLAVHDGGWREAYVVRLADGRLVESLSAAFDPVPARAARAGRARRPGAPPATLRATGSRTPAAVCAAARCS